MPVVMGRPRKAHALTSAERVRAFRLRQRGVTETSAVTETPAVTETSAVTEGFLDGRFCEWFPWAAFCTLDRLQRSCSNVVLPSHPRFVCKGDSSHSAWWPK